MKPPPKRVSARNPPRSGFNGPSPRSPADGVEVARRRAADQRPISFRRWIRLARASYFVAVDVNVSIELGVVSRLASLRARCAFSRHDHSMSCRSSNVKWHGTSLGFADEVGMYPVCQILVNPTPSIKKIWRRGWGPGK